MKDGFSLPEIEQAFVSCLMQWPEKTFRLLDEYKISAEHFQTPQNRVLFDAVNNFWREGKPVDLIAVTNELRELELLDGVGGAGYVTDTWCVCHAHEAAAYYADIITEHHGRRLIAVSCGEVLKEVNTPLIEVPELISSAVQRFSAIPVKPEQQEHTLAEAVAHLVERMEQGDEASDIIKTGITRIDQQSRLRRSDMPLIVGERKAGKTIMALSIALNVARGGIPVVIFSLEDAEPKVIERLFAGIARVPISKADALTAATAGSTLAGLPIHIKTQRELTAIESISRELKARAQIGLIIVDYAQIVQVPKRKDVNREQEVAEVSRRLRWLAMELNLPIIVLSQLTDGRTRESRSLEQDATACWSVMVPKDDDEKANLRYIVIPWQRNGESGIQFKVTFLGAIARVENFADR